VVDFERFISARSALLNERLVAIDVKAKGGLLPDVMLRTRPGIRFIGSNGRASAHCSGGCAIA
jgi:hypothetical protein